MLKYSKSGTGKVGRHLQYQDDIAYGMEVGRMPIFFTPEKDNVSDGNVLRFVLPAKGNIDFTNFCTLVGFTSLIIEMFSPD